MRSINCTCDLCGRPIDVYNVEGTSTYGLTIHNKSGEGVWQGTSTVDLCKSCFEKLYRWMLTKPFKDDYGYTNIMVPIEKEDQNEKKI